MHLEVVMQLLQPYAGLFFALCFVYLTLPIIKHEAIHALRTLFWFCVFQYIGIERIHHAVHQSIQYVSKEATARTGTTNNPSGRWW